MNGIENTRGVGEAPALSEALQRYGVTGNRPAALRSGAATRKGERRSTPGHQGVIGTGSEPRIEAGDLLTHELTQCVTAIHLNASAALMMLPPEGSDHPLRETLDDIVDTTERMADGLRGMRSLLVILTDLAASPMRLVRERPAVIQYGDGEDAEEASGVGSMAGRSRRVATANQR